jgi:hypothetical protein
VIIRSGQPTTKVVIFDPHAMRDACTDLDEAEAIIEANGPEVK